MVRFQSRCEDAALVNAAFRIRWKGAYMCRFKNHPMRYWVVVGYGRVPDALRAPKTIYRQCNDALHFSELSEGAAIWVVRANGSKLVSLSGLANMEERLREFEWVGVLDVRDDTTVDNLKIAPPGSDEIVFSREAEDEKSKTFCAPIDAATGREYFEVTSGDLAVICLSLSHGQSISVCNVACGKWFWQFHDFGKNVMLFHDFGRPAEQLVLWNELVDANEEYKNPYSGSIEDLLDFECSDVFSELRKVRKDRAEALTVAEAFLWSADVEPLIKTALVDFLTVDPDGLWWKRAELPDGFLEAGRLSLASRIVVCEGNSIFNKFQFAGLVFSWDGDFVDDFSKTNALTWAVPGGCAYHVKTLWVNGWLQFKLHKCTKKIVAVRVVLS